MNHKEKQYDTGSRYANGFPRGLRSRMAQREPEGPNGGAAALGHGRSSGELSLAVWRHTPRGR
jgi:hypothetical protein